MAGFLYDTLLPLGGADILQSENEPEDILKESPDHSSQLASSETLDIVEDEIRFLKGNIGTDDKEFHDDSTILRREICESGVSVVDSSSLLEEDFFSLDNEIIVTKPSQEPAAVAVSDDRLIVEDKKAEDSPPVYPWQAASSIRSPLLLLHQEIANFCEFISPTVEEQAARAKAVERISEALKTLWPACRVEVFGSFETGLYLPASDIDLVILNSNVEVPQEGLHAIAKILHRKSLGKKIQVIGKARVPIIKFIESISNVAVDISFDVQNGPEAAKFIKDAVAKIPPLKPLCMILKIFLQQRELNEVYTGGIGSYALLVMLMSHLQMHWSRESYNSSFAALEQNLGILLIDFFNLYGRRLNAQNVGISCRSGGTFYNKSSKGFWNSKRPYLLSVEDPQAPENDIGKNSYNIIKVQAAFAIAYRLLTDIHDIDFSKPSYSLLGRIIKVDEKLRERSMCMNLSFLQPLSTDEYQNLTCNTDSEEIMIHPLITKQIELSERLQLYDDDEPLPRGGELSGNSKKRKTTDGSNNADSKDFTRRQHKKFSGRKGGRGNNNAASDEKAQNKKRKQNNGSSNFSRKYYKHKSTKDSERKNDDHYAPSKRRKHF